MQPIAIEFPNQEVIPTGPAKLETDPAERMLSQVRCLRQVDALAVVAQACLVRCTSVALPAVTAVREPVFRRPCVWVPRDRVPVVHEIPPAKLALLLTLLTARFGFQ